jgi:hypothetical protein
VDTRMETDSARRLAVLESIGSLFWFLMDGCWMLGLGGLARALALPTVATQLVALRHTPRSVVELAITGSINCWVLMNVFWMFGDLDDRPGLLTAARFAFAAGLGLLSLAALHARSTAELRKRALVRFRRLRLPMR